MKALSTGIMLLKMFLILDFHIIEVYLMKSVQYSKFCRFQNLKPFWSHAFQMSITHPISKEPRIVLL